MELDVAHLQQWIGRNAEADDLVTPRLVAEYRATFAPRLFERREGEAPLGLHWCLSPPIAPMADLGPDGHPTTGGFLPPVPLPRRMWAGGEIETHGALRVGDDVTRTSTIGGVTAKQGRSGPLCFVAVRHGYATPRGLAVTERHDIVYRAADPGSASPRSAPSDPARPRQADLRWTIETSPVLLFRYSAMTFNGHRIHYDQPYVTGVEVYPGLVVHGPIQATLCFNIAAELLGTVPRRFHYRNLSPLTAGDAFTVAGAKHADGTVASWTESADGRTCMEGEASA